MKRVILFLSLICCMVVRAQDVGLYPTINPETNKMGLADIDGKLVLPCNYPYTGKVSDKIYYASDSRDIFFAFFSDKGVQLTDYKYLKYGPVAENGLFKVCDKNEKIGFMNEAGEEVIPCLYEEASMFAYGLAPVLRYKRTSQMTATFNEETRMFELNSSWGYINEKGVDIFDCSYEYASDFVNGLAAVKKNDKWGFINTSGELVVECIYDKITNHIEGIAFVCVDGKWGAIDGNGKILFDCQYDKITNHKEGIALVCAAGKWGAIDGNGKVLFDCQYDDVRQYHEGYAAVKIAPSEWSFLDSLGNVATTERYVFVGDFHDGCAAVLSKDGDCFYIDKSFRKIESIGSHETLHPLSEKIAMCVDNDKYSFYHKNEGLITEELFDEAFPFSGGVAVVKKNGVYGAINTSGEVIIPFKYEDPEYPLFKYEIWQYQNYVDVDRGIPINKDKNENSYAVIISNENYSDENIKSVDYAINDGRIFKEYCVKTLGIPEQNIRYVENATLNNIRSQINWLKDITQVYNGNAKVIFYYAGHGIPDETNNSSYLLPVDGIGNDPRSAYSLNDLYSQLGELTAKQIVVFMDACFSGTKRDGKMLTSARGVVIKAKSGTPKGNMVVFSASQGDETAHQYAKKKHGMFTYFLLKKLQETKGKITIENLATYIKEQVQKCSMKENGKLQTPTLQLSPDFQTSIGKITL